jgi:uncharacterized membrane protein YcaP (DUF421 family)
VEFVQILIELVIGFFALLILTKILGKTQISQITAFDFISAIVLGELVGNALYDEHINIGKVLFAVAIWGLLIYGTEFLTQKGKKFRKILEGEPSLIIEKGKINFGELKKNHLDMNQVLHLLRAKNCFSIRECEYAILETDGKISVMKKPDYSVVTIGDLQLPLNPVVLPVILILDGEIDQKNLKMINWDIPRLIDEINRIGIQSIKDVLYAEYKEGEELFVQKY